MCDDFEMFKGTFLSASVNPAKVEKWIYFINVQWRKTDSLCTKEKKNLEKCSKEALSSIIRRTTRDPKLYCCSQPKPSPHFQPKQAPLDMDTESSWRLHFERELGPKGNANDSWKGVNRSKGLANLLLFSAIIQYQLKWLKCTLASIWSASKSSCYKYKPLQDMLWIQ